MSLAAVGATAAKAIAPAAAGGAGAATAASIAAGGASSLFGNIAAKKRQQRAMLYNMLEAEKSRKWQENMRSTAYQTSVEDMKRAGLNPKMMYGSGSSPASAPSGTKADFSATPNPDMSGITALIPFMSGLIKSAIEEKDVNSRVEQRMAEVKKVDEQKELIKSQVDNVKALTTEISQKIKESEQRVKESTEKTEWQKKQNSIFEKYKYQIQRNNDILDRKFEQLDYLVEQDQYRAEMLEKDANIKTMEMQRIGKEFEQLKTYMELYKQRMRNAINAAQWEDIYRNQNNALNQLNKFVNIFKMGGSSVPRPGGDKTFNYNYPR